MIQLHDHQITERDNPMRTCRSCEWEDNRSRPSDVWVIRTDKDGNVRGQGVCAHHFNEYHVNSYVQPGNHLFFSPAIESPAGTDITGIRISDSYVPPRCWVDDMVEYVQGLAALPYDERLAYAKANHPSVVQ